MERKAGAQQEVDKSLKNKSQWWRHQATGGEGREVALGHCCKEVLKWPRTSSQLPRPKKRK